MREPIALSITEGLARITLNRPARLNAFDPGMAHAWEQAATIATSRDDVGAILVAGNGPSFCAGGDVVAMSGEGVSQFNLETLANTINRGITALLESSLPVVAAAHGTTAGGGLGILLASDVAVIGSGSRLGSRYANLGLTPDLSVTAQLSMAVGQRRALQLLLTDKMLTAAEALDWGLAAEVVVGPEGGDEASLVRQRALAIAQSWLEGASSAFGQAKRLVRAQPGRDPGEQLADEARTIAASLRTPQAQARIRAFVNKHPS